MSNAVDAGARLCADCSHVHGGRAYGLCLVPGCDCLVPRAPGSPSSHGGQIVIPRIARGNAFDLAMADDKQFLDTLERVLATLRASVGVPEQRPPVPLTEQLVEDYLALSKRRGNSRHWRADQRRYLSWWRQRLAGVNLRGAELAALLSHLRIGISARRQRIVVLKSLYTYLRVELQIITTAEDPTYGRLPAPQCAPAQLTTDKVIPLSSVTRARAHLALHWRDGLDVLCGTGWHVTELQRFAQGGLVDVVPRAGGLGVLVCPRSKGKAVLRTAVSGEVLAAAQRVREHGGFSIEWFGRAVRAACVAGGVPPFTPGRFRHTVATWAIEHGADARAVSLFLGHRAEATTKRFYATNAVPTKVPTPL